jgi:adenine-specific DNA-methyltransferase
MSKKIQEYTKEELLQYIKDIKKSKQFGLVWEPQLEQVVKDVEEKLPVIDEESNRAITDDEDKPTHLIIEGDNFHSLSVLNYTHASMIDVIYIDPPYNTGNKDFTYNDHYIDREDSYRHSKWLSFMNARLKLAKSLLSKDGFIFVSIDDNELANLKILMDQIFGSENYINTISIKAKPSAGASGGGEDKRLKKNIEYLLAYGGHDFERFESIYKHTNLMTYIKEMKDEGKSFKYTSVLVDTGKRKDFTTIKDGSGNDIKIFKHSNIVVKSVAQVAKDVGMNIDDVYRKYYEKIITTTNAQSSIRARVWEATGNENEFYSIEYVPKSGRNKGKLTTQYYTGKKKVLVIWLSDTAEREGRSIYKKEKYGTFWDGINWNNVNKEGDVEFSNGKKPIELIQRILKMHSSKNILVLDFFAGSGSTGHAVLAQNKEDAGNRQFILCTNNENGIAENITYKRIKNVVKGYGNTDAIKANVRYFKTDFVKKIETLDKLRRELSPACEDMIRIREGAYEVVVDEQMLKIFKNTRGLTAVVYDRFELSKYINKIEDIHTDSPVHLYVFSYDKSVRDEEMPDELKHAYETQPIPEGVLEIYCKIFRKNGAQND